MCRRRFSIPLPALPALPALLALTAACGGDAPSEPAPTAPLTLCAREQWMAYRNEDGGWTRLASGSLTPVTFEATERLAVASASGIGMPNVTPHLRVDFLTAGQARRQFACPEGGGPPITSGTVSGIAYGIASGGWAQLQYGGRSGVSTLRADDPRFSLWALDGDNDLVAARWPTDQLQPDHADRAIVRRAQRYAAGSSIALDFASDEAFPLVPHTLSWTGPTAHVQLNFLTAEGNDLLLQSTVTGAVPADAPRSAPLYSIPAARLAPGDLHQLAVGGDFRSVWLWYREPADRTITWGPPANEPAFRTVGTSPTVRLRMDVASQLEYGASISASLRQFAVTNGFLGATILVSMTATREYFGGTPREWTLEMPDLSRVPGFENVLGLRPGEYEWGFSVTSSPFGSGPADATDGMVIRRAWGAGAGTVPVPVPVP